MPKGRKYRQQQGEIEHELRCDCGKEFRGPQRAAEKFIELHAKVCEKGAGLAKKDLMVLPYDAARCQPFEITNRQYVQAMKGWDMYGKLERGTMFVTSHPRQAYSGLVPPEGDPHNERQE